MKKWPNFIWHNRLKIGTKQFIFLFIATTAIFGSLFWNNLRTTEKLFQNQVIYDSQKLLDNTNQFLNSYLENIQSILLSLSTNEQLVIDGNEAELNKWLRETADINSNVVDTIYIINNNGNVYSSHNVYYEILGNPNISYLYGLSKKNYGGINWSQPYHSPLSAGKTVAFVSPMTNKSNEFIATAVVEIDLTQLSNRLSSMLWNKNQTFIIITSSGQIVSTDTRSSIIPHDQTVYPEQPSQDFINQIKQLSVGVTNLEKLDLPLIAIKSDSNRLGWHLISLIDESVFYENVNRLYENFRNAALLLIVILFISSFMLSRYLTNPIRKLANKMDNVTNINNMSSISVDREDEIGSLAKSYNAMVERIKFLFKENQKIEQQKKEYELKMLQSQIGPHFLYNTLACIGSLVKQNRKQDVLETIRSLVGLLSFSFDKRSEFVSLKEELESVRMYAQIQKVRYGNETFKLLIDVNTDVDKCKIPKLTLQPFVENAIFHGISPKGSTGIITIKVRTAGQNLNILIRDNGIGMDEDRQKTILSKSAQTRFNGGFNSVGVRNVHERIRINFGDKYGVKIVSKKGIGTVVRIKIPNSEVNGQTDEI